MGQHVTHCFPGRGGLRLQHSAWRDFDRAPDGHRQRSVRLLHRKKGHGITKKVHVMARDTRLRQYEEFIAGAHLLSTITWSEVDNVMADRDGARVRVRGGVLHPATILADLAQHLNLGQPEPCSAPSAPGAEQGSGMVEHGCVAGARRAQPGP